MSKQDLCTEEEVTRLVHLFYQRVRADAMLGPIFEAHVANWDDHLAKLVDFWSSVLRGTARFRGAPMPTHARLDGLEPALFHRWLALFAQTTAEIGNPAMQSRANMLAGRIAESLWYGYQLQRCPGEIPRDLV